MLTMNEIEDFCYDTYIGEIGYNYDGSVLFMTKDKWYKIMLSKNEINEGFVEIDGFSIYDVMYVKKVKYL